MENITIGMCCGSTAAQDHFVMTEQRREGRLIRPSAQVSKAKIPMRYLIISCSFYSIKTMKQLHVKVAEALILT